MTVITAIIALLKAIPALKELWDEIAVAWLEWSIRTMKKELQDAVLKAVAEHNQIPLERFIGSPRAGLPSGEHGSEIVDHLPGVDNEPGK